MGRITESFSQMDTCIWRECRRRCCFFIIYSIAHYGTELIIIYITKATASRNSGTYIQHCCIHVYVYSDTAFHSNYQSPSFQTLLSLYHNE